MTFARGILILLVLSSGARAQGWMGTVPAQEFTEISRLIEQRNFSLARHGLDRLRQDFQGLPASPGSHFRDLEFFQCLEATWSMHPDAERRSLNFLSAYPHYLGNSRLSFALGLYRMVQNRGEEALEMFNKVNWYSLSVEQAQQYLFLRGQLLLYRNRQEALAAWQQVAGGGGDFADHARYSLALACIEDGKWSQAAVSLDSLRTTPLYKGYWEYPRIVTSLYQGDTGTAMAFVDSFREDTMVLQRAAIMRLGANCAYQQGNSDAFQVNLAALLVLGEALTNSDTLKLAQMLYQQGQWDTVTALLRQIESWPENLKVVALYTLADTWMRWSIERPEDRKLKKRALDAYFRVSELAEEGERREFALYCYAKLNFEVEEAPRNFRSLSSFLQQYPNSVYRDEISEYLSALALKARNYQVSINVLREIRNRSTKVTGIIQKLSYLQAITLFNRQQYVEALPYLDSVLALRGDSLWPLAAMFWKSELYHRMGEFNQAFLWMKNFVDKGFFGPDLLQLGCSELLACYQLGHLSYKLDKSSQAQAYWSRCLKVGKAMASRSPYENAVYRDAHLRLGDAYLKDGQATKAVNQFTLCIRELAVGVEYAHYQLAVAYGIQKRFGPKRTELVYLIEEYPESDYKIYALLELALTCYQESSFDSVLMCYRMMEEEFPDHRLTFFAANLRGSVYVERGKDMEALSVFEGVVQRASGLPEARDAMYEIRQLCIRNNLPDVYMSLAEKNGYKSIQDDPRDTILYETAMFSFNSGKYFEAMTVFSRYLTDYPKGSFLAEVLYFRSVCAAKVEDRPRQLADLNLLLRMSNNLYTERAMQQLAELYQGMDSLRQAEKVYRRLQDATFSYTTRLDAAMGQMRCATLLEEWKVTDSLTLIYGSQEALSPQVRNEIDWHRANALRRQGLLNKAIPMLRVLADSNTSEWAARSLFNLAEIAMERKELGKSEDYLYDLEERFPQHREWVGQAILLLSEISLLKGDEDYAIRLLQKIVSEFDAGTISRTAAIRLQQLER